jgi:WD40 repeat protein
VRCWELPTGRLLWEVQVQVGRLPSVSLESDEDIVVVGSGDGTVISWDASTGREISRFVNPVGRPRSVGTSPGGEVLAIGSDDGGIHVRNRRSGQPVASLLGHRGRVLMVDVRDDGRLVSAAADGTVRAWSLDSQRVTSQIRVDATLHCAAASATCGRVLVGSAAGVACLELGTAADPPPPEEPW